VLFSGCPVRHTVLLLVFALAACPSGSRETLDVGGDDGAGGPGAGSIPQQCFADTDCATAAATCCECPAFAVSVNDPAQRACDGVSCPGQGACPDNVRAACDLGECVLACVELECTETCAAGYTIDPTGCLSCACAAPEPGGCMRDSDCVQTRADCCGCDQGGADTAVLAASLGGFEADLGCPASPACPSVNVCEPGATPQCVQGACELAVGGLPIGACGRPDLPACPGGGRCLLNTTDQANQHGVGVCGPP